MFLALEWHLVVAVEGHEGPHKCVEVSDVHVIEEVWETACEFGGRMCK